MILTVGNSLQVLDDTRNWWKLKNHEGHIGYAPYTILKEYEANGMGDFDKVNTLGTLLVTFVVFTQVNLIPKFVPVGNIPKEQLVL